MAKLRGSRRPATITMDRIRQKAVVLGRCEGAFSRCSSPPVSEFLPLELKNAFSGRSVRLWGHIKRREAPRTYSLEVCSNFLGPQTKLHRHDRLLRSSELRRSHFSESRPAPHDRRRADNCSIRVCLSCLTCTLGERNEGW